MSQRTLTLGHSPDPDDAFMFYGLAKDLIATDGFRFEHILQDIQTLNERATRGELDISAISIHAYAYVSDKYALLPSGASMGDGYGPILVAKRKFRKEEIATKRIAVPGTMTSAFLALQLWLGRTAKDFDYVVVPFDRIFETVRSGGAEVGLIIHEGQLTYKNEDLELCEDLGAWWGLENEGLLPESHCKFQSESFASPAALKANDELAGACACDGSRVRVTRLTQSSGGLAHKRKSEPPP